MCIANFKENLRKEWMHMAKYDKPAPSGYHYIFVRYITRNGVRIYPKNAKAFRLLVKDN